MRHILWKKLAVVPVILIGLVFAVFWMIDGALTAKLNPHNLAMYFA